MMIANCIVLTKGFILCIVQVTVVQHSIIYHYYACATHALRMFYEFIMILVQKNYITLQLRYNTYVTFFDSYHILISTIKYHDYRTWVIAYVQS